MARGYEEEPDEIEEGYIAQYRLGEDLAIGRKKRAIFLLASIRKLRRLAFTDRNGANAGLAKMDRLLAETRVFHAADHAGYNELLDFLTASLASLSERAREKFPQ
jgi:hypothetical protein